jgi:hypothetical protein
MDELHTKLYKGTFKRFKLIKHLINKYPIIEINESPIQKIKDAYIEYEPKYVTINKKLKFDKSEFISEEIDNEINKFDVYTEIIEETFGENNFIDIKVGYNSKDPNIDINIIMKTVYSIVKLFKKLYGKKDISVKVGLTNIDRNIDSDVIKMANVNGGLMWVGTGNIIILRKEELYKVICHELSHVYELECQNIDNYIPKIMNKFKVKTFSIQNYIGEGYAEYQAMLHHIALLSFYTKQSIRLFYHYEKIWSLYQVCKILNNYGMTKFEDLYVKEFKQGANVFSYYIVKFFLLYKLNDSCNYKILQNILDDQDIIQIINENMNQKFDSNLRMTLFELLY